MRISKDDKIAGFPAVAVRDFLRRGVSSEFDFRVVMDWFSISQSGAKKFMLELEKLRFICKAEYLSPKSATDRYQTTVRGNALAQASTAKPISRATAEKNLQEFLRRVRTVNDEDAYLYRVESVLVFGSYLSAKDRLNDVDIAIELTPRSKDPNTFRSLCERRIREAIEKGRRFGNITEETNWPQMEVLLYLKNRSRVIKLHGFQPFSWMEDVTYRVVLGDRKRIESIMKKGRIVP